MLMVPASADSVSWCRVPPGHKMVACRSGGSISLVTAAGERWVTLMGRRHSASDTLLEALLAGTGDLYILESVTSQEEIVLHTF